jgi:predicted Zn finger-like uncharacterized protein
MISVRCPECGSRLEVDDEHLGLDVRCPACRAVFEARPGDARPSRRAPDEDDDRPRRPRDDSDDEEDYQPRRRRRRSREDVIDDARRAVFLPALFSAIACILAVLFHAADTAFIIANPNALKNNPLANLGGGQPPPMEVVYATKAFILLYGLVATAGSFAMMRLKARPFAVTAMVLQIVPCLGACCLLTLPLGIWGLIVLNNPDVKDAFELAAAEDRRPARDRDRDDRGYDDEEDDRWRDR